MTREATAKTAAVNVSGAGRANRVAARVATLIALAALAWILAGLWWRWMGHGVTVAAPPVTVASPGVSPARQAPPRLSAVVDRPLFGAPQDAAAAPVAIDAPDTRLRVELTGIAAIGAGGAAFVRVEGRPERLVRPGDALGVGNARVLAIEADRLIIDREGRTEQVRLPRLDGRPGAPVPQGASGARLGAGSGIGVTADPVAVGGADDGGLGPDEPVIERERWLSNPEALAQAVQLRPVTRDGQFVGVALRPTRNQREFAAAGLRPGDIVTAIEGMPVATIVDPEALLAQYASATQIRLSIERDGSPLDLTIRLR